MTEEQLREKFEYQQWGTCAHERRANGNYVSYTTQKWWEGFKAGYALAQKEGKEEQ